MFLSFSLDGQSLGMDAIGFPGVRSDALSFARHLALRRAGIRLFPLGYPEWMVRRGEVLHRLDDWLGGAVESE